LTNGNGKQTETTGNKNMKDVIYGSVAGLVIVMILFGVFSTLSTRRNLRQEAIQLGYAEYNATNGIWQWKTNLVEK